MSGSDEVASNRLGCEEQWKEFPREYASYRNCYLFLQTTLRTHPSACTHRYADAAGTYMTPVIMRYYVTVIPSWPVATEERLRVRITRVSIVSRKRERVKCTVRRIRKIALTRFDLYIGIY